MSCQMLSVSPSSVQTYVACGAGFSTSDGGSSSQPCTSCEFAPLQACLGSWLEPMFQLPRSSTPHWECPRSEGSYPKEHRGGGVGAGPGGKWKLCHPGSVTRIGATWPPPAGPHTALASAWTSVWPTPKSGAKNSDWFP